MQTENFIPANELCVHHNIEFSFINSLHEYGLIEVFFNEGSEFINANQLNDLEKFIRLHYELNINVEGIDAINNLLQKMDVLHSELSSLKNRLRLYETNDF